MGFGDDFKHVFGERSGFAGVENTGQLCPD
jgi:hypothetical protein